MAEPPRMAGPPARCEATPSPESDRAWSPDPDPAPSPESDRAPSLGPAAGSGSFGQTAPSGEPPPGAVTRARLAEIFGDVLPESTGDDRDVDGQTRQPGDDRWYTENRPPHHDSS